MDKQRSTKHDTLYILKLWYVSIFQVNMLKLSNTFIETKICIFYYY